MKLTIKHATDKAAICAYINALPDGKHYDVTIAKHKDKRSISQHRLMWLWITCIADDTGGDKDQIHEELKAMFLPRVQVVGLYGELHQRPVSTTALNKEQFTEYLQKVQVFAAAELGVSLPEPADLIFESFYEHYENRI
jgi:hypothetical protein